MATQITLEDLETKFFTKKQLQDENVRLGLARCENELKAKTIAKLRAHLLAVQVTTRAGQRPIPKKIQQETWMLSFGDSLKGRCFCCKEELTVFEDWHVGHIVPTVKGGLDVASNLRPVCGSCFDGLGTEDMIIFKARCYPE